MHDSKIIEFRGIPLFQKARFKPEEIMQGSFSEFACFFYMLKGNLISYDRRGKHQVEEKNAIVKNCGNYVTKYVPTDNDEYCEAIAVYLYPDLLKEVYKNEVPGFLEHGSIPEPKKLIANELVEQFVMNITLYFESPEVVDEELGMLKIRELITILLKSENHENVVQLLSEIFAPVNVSFRNSIRENLYNSLTLDQLAFICNMSLSTFKREFKKLFDETPARYIKRKRLERAAQLLLATEDKVSAIGYDCGFQDVTTFSELFKKQYGKSPKNYRMDKNRK